MAFLVALGLLLATGGFIFLLDQYVIRDLGLGGWDGWK